MDYGAANGGPQDQSRTFYNPNEDSRRHFNGSIDVSMKSRPRTANSDEQNVFFQRHGFAGNGNFHSTARDKNAPKDYRVIDGGISEDHEDDEDI